MFLSGMVFGPLFGRLGWVSRRDDGLGLLATMALAGLCAGEAVVLVGWRSGVRRPAVLVAVAAAIAIVWLSPRRRLGFVLLAPAALAGTLVHQALTGLARLVFV